MFEKICAGIVIGIIAIILFAVLSLVGAIPTYFLWNWLMPSIFGLKVVTFWQAWGINFLSAILFKNSSISSSSKSD